MFADAGSLEMDHATNLRTEILDFRGFGSSRILILRGGIPRPKGNFPEMLSQGILAGVILVGRWTARPPPRQGIEGLQNIADFYFNVKIQESLQKIVDYYVNVEIK